MKSPPDKGTSEMMEAPETQGKDNQYNTGLSLCVFFVWVGLNSFLVIRLEKRINVLRYNREWKKN